MQIPAPSGAQLLSDVVHADGAEATWRRLECDEFRAFYFDEAGQRIEVEPTIWRRTVYTSQKLDDGTEFTKWHPAQLLATGYLGWITSCPVYIPDTRPFLSQEHQGNAEVSAVIGKEVYLSPLMKMMIEAIVEFEITDEPNPRRKKKELVDHFKSLTHPDGSKISDHLAEAMGTLIRPHTAMRGGQKRMG